MSRFPSRVPAPTPAAAAELRAEQSRAIGVHGSADDRSDNADLRPAQVGSPTEQDTGSYLNRKPVENRFVRPDQTRPVLHASDAGGGADTWTGGRLRTDESVLAESEYERWTEEPPSDRPLIRWRKSAADTFFSMLLGRKCSQRKAAILLGVNDKRIGKYLDTSTHIPIEVLLALPIEMAIEYADKLFAVRGGSGTRAIASMRTALATLEKPNAVSFRDVDELEDINRRVGAVLLRAAKEGR